MEITESEQQKEKKINEKFKDTTWDSIKHTKILIINVPEEEKEERIENIFDKIMTKIFPNLKKETDNPVQKERVLDKMNTNGPTPRYIIIKMIKFNGKCNSKVSKKKQSYTRDSL